MSDTPSQLSEVVVRVEPALSQILNEERARWAAYDADLEVPLAELSDFIIGGGKRIRPAYCYWGWVTAGGDPAHHDAVAGGCALELLHAFALVHDDVMDGSPTRRGRPTVWVRFIERHRTGAWRGEDRRFGEAAAVLVGDMAMALADRTLGATTPIVREVWDALRAELNMGQYLDVIGTARGDVGTEQAHAIIRNKTAGYTIVRPLQLGAALAGRDDLHEALAAHGMPLGIAFQLRDDMLGAFGDETVTGKPVGEDLREGKPTVLLARARELADGAQREVLARVGYGLSDGDLAAIQEVMVETGAVASCEAEIEQLLVEATAALGHLPDVDGSRAALAALGDYVAERDT